MSLKGKGRKKGKNERKMERAVAPNSGVARNLCWGQEARHRMRLDRDAECVEEEWEGGFPLHSQLKGSGGRFRMF